MANNGICEWNNAAETYSKLQATSAYADFTKEYVKTLITNISGFKVLDAGCGDGYYTNYFHEQGANVIGCDGSSEMVRLAQSRYPSLQFDIVDLQEQLPYSDQQFDLVFCNLVLMDIEYIDLLVSEVSRVLKKGGLFVFTILHPSFYLGKWEFDRTGRRTYRKVANYINPVSHKMYFWGTTTHYHRPLSFYLNLLSNHNLLLDKMYEPAIPTREAGSYKRPLTAVRIKIAFFSLARAIKHHFVSIKPYTYEEPLTRIPLFLFARFVKHSL